MAYRKNKLTPLARGLRKRMTTPERRLWRRLRGRQIGTKFRRQEPLCGYIVDFVCYENKVIVELDGGQHGEEAGRQADAIRDATLEAAGYRVLRFWNWQVYEELEVILEAIYSECMVLESE